MSLVKMIWEATFELLNREVAVNEVFRDWLYTEKLPHVEGAGILLDELIRRGVVRGWSATEIAQEIISKRERAFAQVQKGGEA